ncbi:MAG: septum formation initiator family protein [Clostridia bacterium]|nr:septum formation initiator family protein [Clostridia bacterium]
MADNTRMYENRNIKGAHSQYNNVRRQNVSVSDMAYVAVEKLGDAVAARNRRVARERAEAPVVVKKRVKSAPFPVRFVFYALIATVMLMFIVYTNSVVNEISYDIGDLKTKISETRAENEKLSIELDKKYDLKYIEEVATKELGLVKSTEVVKHYVSISGNDDVVIANETGAASTNLGVTLDSLKQSVAKIYK